MTKNEKDVLQVMQNCSNRVSITNQGEGWINLASLGLELRKNGIDYSRLGFDKLITFMKSIHGVELFRDESKTLPVVYVRESSDDPKKDENDGQSDINLINPSQLLMNWAFMGYIPEKFSKLKGMALAEDWGTIENSDGKKVYPKNDKGEEYYPILYNYLIYTFYKQYRDKNIFYSKNGYYAVFNTGLVDDRYKQIYALFGKNRDQNRNVEWYLIDFCIQGENSAGKTLVAQFDKMPPVAHYFKKVTDLLYDTRIENPLLDYQHIIIERVDRLPSDFINANAPRGFEIQDTKCMTGDERKEYFNNLRQAIQNDPVCYRQMTDRLDSALSVSIERVKWNFKSAIPMYYPKKNKMCLFLPLCLIKDNKVDIALVVEKTPSGRYQGSTIYKLGWAYKCARLVCRPDSDWLTVSMTNSGQDEVDDIE